MVSKLTSYAPEYMELFRRGAQSPIEVKLSTENAATHMRSRMYKFRRIMRDEQHPMTAIANSVQIAIHDETYVHAGEDKVRWVLTCKPADYKFLTAIADAGIDIADAPDLTPTPELPPQPTESDPMEDFIKPPIQEKSDGTV